MKARVLLRLWWPAGLILLIAQPALATQAHSAPEGLYAHQLAHLFFIVSMGVLIYWLRARQLVKVVGWRHIQYAALFFILWNVDAICVHLLEEQLAVVSVERLEGWQIRISAPNHPGLALEWLYYAVKLDHLLCVPALLFLYSGLKRLLKETNSDSRRATQP
jgi:hypothetical protein